MIDVNDLMLPHPGEAKDHTSPQASETKEAFFVFIPFLLEDAAVQTVTLLANDMPYATQ
ncbi:hypothetical protein VCSRO155_1840 [Vibrio cholerae]|nr:hypothetical protein DA89_2904 [Vibrio paracholerae]GHW95826.1 hypothetical protein VCSRO155_1840 [Vibrio cholerae]GHX38125.1 hypothetical protein VCSRO108_1963 [Vibrio cholerae]